MLKKRTAARQRNERDEAVRLALLHQVESRLRARSGGKIHASYGDLEVRLENQITDILESRDPAKKTASKMRSIRNLIEHSPL